MTINPTPYVELDGTRLYCKPDRRDRGVTILDDLSINWGREHPLAERGPGAAQFRLWDADGYWLARARSATSIISESPVLGVSVVIGWEWFDFATGTGAQRIIFRGTVSNFDLRASHLRVSENTTVKGWEIAITATDRTVDLGLNRVAENVETWPAESAILRANRLRDAIAGAGIDIAEVYFEPDTVSWPMGKTKVKDKTILQLLDEFYMSFGLTWDYRPDENVTRPAPIDPIGQYVTLYRVPDTNDHVLMPDAQTLTGFGNDTATYYGTAVPGCAVTTADNAMSVERTDRTNRIHLTYSRADGTESWTAVSWAGAVKKRQMTMSTWLNLDSPNSNNSSRVWDHRSHAIEASNWPAMPTVIYDTKHTGGFFGVEAAYVLTRACQSWSKVTIPGNPFAAALARQSQFQIIGGTVRYLDGRWIVDMIPAWIYAPGTDRTWADFGANGAVAQLTWNDPGGRFDPSVTWADLVTIARVAEQPVPAPVIP
ncbi:hypothetical protein [Gordonia sp. MMO-8]|uniref:hypothetical protein n=1 Tax=Gordonia sp. MMO-8 TaxID=3127886 RepID=UPI003015B482